MERVDGHTKVKYPTSRQKVGRKERRRGRVSPGNNGRPTSTTTKTSLVVEGSFSKTVHHRVTTRPPVRWTPTRKTGATDGPDEKPENPETDR